MIVEDLLTPRESALISAMTDRPGASREELAKELNVTARYVRKLLARQRVRKALDASARAGLASASTVLGQGAQRAAEALLAMATGAARATTPRVAACRAVLDGAGQLIDLVDLRDKVMQLIAERDAPTGGVQ